MRDCKEKAVKDFLALEPVMHRKRGILYRVQYGLRRQEEMGGVFMRVNMSKSILVLLSLSIYHFSCICHLLSLCRYPSGAPLASEL